MAPQYVGALDKYGPDRNTYVAVFNSFARHIDKSKIVMGFQPGHQNEDGVWEGMEMDNQVIDYIQANGYGGILFWAVNDKNVHNGVLTGENVIEIAEYAASVFN